MTASRTQHTVPLADTGQSQRTAELVERSRQEGRGVYWCEKQ